ncbi:hypothetical protein ES332_D11G179800v1 [Gossypium tomentosum]|uniref:Uncharacterized protein n=1 Tax=Gossypium tomentosum TaxID=34277 RepID=A0A5D2IQB1_GOSTO|nr:hypothetical protein ES332_D11G179800v1 [Gossypium tomentosum]
MLLQPDSVPPLLPPLAIIAIPPSAPIRDSPPILIFFFVFCPHQLHPLRHFPSILQG